MAKQVEQGKFLVIECTAGELMNAVGTDLCMCDWCNKGCLPSDKGYYIAVLNQWYCEKCYTEWAESAVWYPEDADVQHKNFEFYAPLLGIKCQ